VEIGERWTGERCQYFVFFWSIIVFLDNQKENKNFGSVHVNDNSGNPFQVDINYRGYTASP
jgi:hypothetical protein